MLHLPALYQTLWAGLLLVVSLIFFLHGHRMAAAALGVLPRHNNM